MKKQLTTLMLLAIFIKLHGLDGGEVRIDKERIVGVSQFDDKSTAVLVDLGRRHAHTYLVQETVDQVVEIIKNAK